MDLIVIQSGGDYFSFYHIPSIQALLPKGWIIPTDKHFQHLAKHGSTWRNKGENGVPISGRFFGKNHDMANYDNRRECIFLPAVGYRDNSNGALYNQGFHGHYWSSTPNGDYGHILSFYSGFSFLDFYDKAYGFSVCAVREI